MFAKHIWCIYAYRAGSGWYRPFVVLRTSGSGPVRSDGSRFGLVRSAPPVAVRSDRCPAPARPGSAWFDKGKTIVYSVLCHFPLCVTYEVRRPVSPLFSYVHVYVYGLVYVLLSLSCIVSCIASPRLHFTLLFSVKCACTLLFCLFRYMFRVCVFLYMFIYSVHVYFPLCHLYRIHVHDHDTREYNITHI